jgi:hypothetical protein
MRLPTRRVLDKPIDNPVLHCIHDQRENKHHKRDLNRFIPLCPSQRPIADPSNPRQKLEDEEDAQLHAEKTEEVDERLFEPPGYAGGVAVISRTDGFWGVGEHGKGETTVEEFQENNEDGDTDSCLDGVSN